MVMEGQIDWTLVFAALAAGALALAVLAWVFALSREGRQEVSGTAVAGAVARAEAAEARTLEILNAIPVALVETDRQGKFVFANRAAHQLLGRRDAELLGLRFHSATWGITYPDGRPVPPDLLPSARALRGQTVKGFQHLLANPATRRKMLVSVTAMPIENARGEIVGSTAAIVETEGLTQPGPEPVETPAPVPPTPSDGLVRRVFESASSALVVVDLDGRVREANPVARGLCGRDDLMMGGDFAELFLAEDERNEARAVVLAALADAEDRPDVIEACEGRAGGTRWRLLPLTGEGGGVEALLLAGERAESDPPSDGLTVDPAGSAAVQTELSDLRARLEAAERDAAQARAEVQAELESARRLEGVGRLTGGVSQDFHALLGVMTSALDMIVSQAEEPDRVRRLGRAALAAGQRGEALTRRLAAFAEGQDDAPIQVIDVSAVVRGLEHRLRLVAGADMDLMVEVPPQPIKARIDPVAMEGALAALVANAAQASGARGSIAVRLARIDDTTLTLAVSDDGEGMAEDTARRAVEPFFTTRPGASGLGLAQVHAFARQSGGDLAIDSAPGGGTSVTVRLPVAD